MTDDTQRAKHAQRLAELHHADQTDKLGVPYIAHVSDVARRVAHHGPQVEAIAWLHDIVEDTDVTLDEIEEQFGSRIAGGVDAMTRRAGEDYFADYLPRLQINTDAVHVKIADASHNWGKVHLLEAVDPDKAATLNRKYAAVLRALGDPSAMRQDLTYVKSGWSIDASDRLDSN